MGTFSIVKLGINGVLSSFKAKSFIMEIGEPLVRQQLLDMYRDSRIAGVKDKIALYEEEIQRLKRDEL